MKSIRTRTRTRLAAALAVALALAAVAPPLYAAVVSGTVNINLSFGEQITSGVTPYTAPAQAQFTANYSNGTGPGQVDTIYAKALTLTGAPQTVDLTSFTDLAGNAGASLARVRELFIYVTDPAATHTVNVYAGASNGWAVVPPSTSPLPCRPANGIIHLSDAQSTGSGAGNVVTSTSKTITFDPGANTVTVYVIAAGCSTP